MREVPGSGRILSEAKGGARKKARAIRALRKNVETQASDAVTASDVLPGALRWTRERGPACHP
jgi:hypothetical protein